MPRRKRTRLTIRSLPLSSIVLRIPSLLSSSESSLSSLELVLVRHSSSAEVERLESSVELLRFGELELPEEEESESSGSDEASNHNSSSSSRAEGRE